MIFAKKATYDWLIVGLGNVGARYDGTRHNVGFACLDAFIKKHGATAYKEKMRAYLAETTVAGNRCLLAKPTTLMNLSGEAVAAITKYYKIPLDRVIVISDDIALDPGRIRVRPSGSHGGHNGLRNIIDCCGGDTFARVRIGVGAKPNPDYDLAAWVLGCYKGEDAEKIRQALDRGADAVETILTSGAEPAMNLYNRQV